MIRCRYCGSPHFYIDASCIIVGNSMTRVCNAEEFKPKLKYAYCRICDNKFASIEELEKAGVLDD